MAENNNENDGGVSFIDVLDSAIKWLMVIFVVWIITWWTMDTFGQMECMENGYSNASTSLTLTVTCDRLYNGRTEVKTLRELREER